MNELHLFAGAGGGILGGMLLGHTCVCAVEIEPYCRKVLLHRQRDGILPKFPIWDDVTTFDGKPWKGLVDVVCGGFPCQDISAAGKGAGITGKRSGLWGEMARIIGEIRPRYAFVENSPLLVGRGLAVVLGDLAEMGYDAKWCVLGANDAGAPHKRDRIWIVADSLRDGCQAYNGRKLVSNQHGQHQAPTPRREVQQSGIGGTSGMADANSFGSFEDFSESQLWANGSQQQSGDTRFADSGEAGKVSTWWDCDPADVSDTDEEGLQRWLQIRELDTPGWEKPGSRPTAERGVVRSRHGDGTGETAQCFMGRVADGVVNRVDRIKAIGNGQVPLCAALAWKILSRVA